MRLAQEQQHGLATTAQDCFGSNPPSVVPSRQCNYSPLSLSSQNSVAFQHSGPPMIIPGPPSTEDMYQQQSNNSVQGYFVPVPSYANDACQNLTGGMSHLDDHVATPAKRSILSHTYLLDQARSAPRPSKSTSSDASAAKSKLPHGLTVHELKEMTKARLQAEASEKRDDPLGQSVPAPSSDFRARYVPSPTAAPSPVQPYYGRSARSPFPDSSYAHHENWSTHSGNDLWESGSVSTQTSDYIGSEQAFGVASFHGDDNALNRSRSMSASSGFGPALDFPHHDPDLAACQSYFDSNNYPSNRRRAATLSPRAGLSHLHEDRPLLPGQELPALPTFQSANRPGCIAPRNRGAFFAPDRYNQGAMVDEANRLRTLSAVSLPAMSRTADEFALSDETGSSRLSQFDSLPEAESRVTGLSDVFRDAPNNVLAPPGFIGGPELRAPTFSSGGLTMGSFGEPRSRASTWGASTTSGLFGHNLFRGHDDSGLSDDLALILKLSGAQEKDELALPPGLM
jgi:hypothetical protein